MTGSVRFWHSTVRMAVNLLLESDEKSCFETTFLSPSINFILTMNFAIPVRENRS